MHRTKNVERPHAATCTMTATISRRKKRANPSPTARPRRRGVQRLRNAYFGKAGEVVARYRVKFERVLMHLWRARRTNRRLFLRQVAHIEDLVLAVACMNGDRNAWSDLSEHFERTLVRRGRDGTEDLAAMVEVRKFIATLRRDSLSGRCALANYTGMRPLRSWLTEALALSKQRSRRSAYLLDPADSCCGTPLQFVRAGG